WVELRLLAEKIRVTKISAALGGDVERRAVSKLAHERNAVWVVLDGYGFQDEYVEGVKRSGCKVMKVDDFASTQTSSADLILNQNVGVSPIDYSDRDHEKLMLGSEYALLRREFRRVKPRSA